MKTKNLLWTLAFVCVGASCSDNLENGPGKNGSDLENGQEAYVKISISTVSDVMGAGALRAGLTRAGEEPSNPNTGGAGWGEDGNGWLGELPGKNEAKIHDINIFLVNAADPVLTKENQLDNINETDAKRIISFAGQGYLGKLNSDVIPDDEPNHDRAEEIVRVTMKELISDEAKNYYVYTIVNAGEDLREKIKDLDALRNFAWDKEVAENEDNVNTADKFVMSTHKMISGATNPSSVVSISSANTKDDPATTSVYVERLAARIDLAYQETLPNENTSSPVYNKGTFTLTDYMVVNQWQGKTNMFKQVTPEIEVYTQDVNERESYKEGMQPRYLGDEVWTIIGEKPNGKFNFVWSQEFYAKTKAEANNDEKWNPMYKNHFFENLNKVMNESGGIQPVPKEESNIYHELGGKKYFPITYVRENTTNTDAQLNGYSTGMIFKTRFAPAEGFEVMAYKNGAINQKTLNTDAPFFFITAEHAGQKGVYQDLKSVAARAFNIPDGDTKNILKSFMEDGWDAAAEDVTLQFLKESIIDKMSSDNELEKKFKDFLSQQLEGVEPLTQPVKDWSDKGNLTYGKFVGGQPSELQPFLNGTMTAGDYTKEIVSKVAETYSNPDSAPGVSGVYIYINGESYHKYWIRHDDNNEPGVMGAMEFAIVRNNVYLLNVTGVRGLGDPLPYTPGKDEPGTPDEENEVTINVTVYVMDWVKRDNGDIIL